MVKLIRAAISTLLLGIAVTQANAHGDMEKIQDALTAPHGGRLRLSGDYYIELVAKPRQLRVYAMRASSKEPVELAQGSGAAIVVMEGRKEVIDLIPDGADLRGDGQFASLDDAIIAIVIRLPDGAQLSGKYSPSTDRH